MNLETVENIKATLDELAETYKLEYTLDLTIKDAHNLNLTEIHNHISEIFYI